MYTIINAHLSAAEQLDARETVSANLKKQVLRTVIDLDYRVSLEALYNFSDRSTYTKTTYLHKYRVLLYMLALTGRINEVVLFN